MKNVRKRQNCVSDHVVRAGEYIDVTIDIFDIIATSYIVGYSSLKSADKYDQCSVMLLFFSLT